VTDVVNGPVSRTDALLAVIVETALNAIVAMDQDGCVTQWNRRAEQLFGWSRDEALGEPVAELIIPPQYRAAHRAGLARYRRTGVGTVLGQVLNITAVKRDGTEFPVELSISPAWRRGEEIAFVAFVRDDTERARAEQLRTMQFTVTRAIAEAMSLDEMADRVLAGIGTTLGWEVGGLWLVDEPAGLLRHRVAWVAEGSDATAFIRTSRATAFAPGAGVPGRVWSEHAAVAVPDVAVDDNFPRQHAAIACGLHGAVGFPVSHGAQVTGVFEFFSREVRPPNEQLLGVMSDIGSQIGQFVQRRHLEEEMRQLNEDLERRVAARTEALEASNQELEAFSYTVSHDLRAPLRAVHSFARILTDDHADELSPDARRHLGVITQNATQMGRLIDGLLAYSRVGRQAVRRADVDTERVVRRALEQLRPDTEGRDLEISIGELPPCRSDPLLVEQVFTNLLANAIKFTRGRTPALVEVGSRTDPRTGELIYQVRDNGVGFDMRYANKLFGVFTRLHRADEFEGTGVGLAIVQRIVQRHGGRVIADSTVGVGTTMGFTLGDQDGEPSG